MRKVPAVLSGLLAALILAIQVANFWGRGRLDAHAAAARTLLEAERKRLAAVRHPVLEGTPRGENAAERHAVLIARVQQALRSSKARPDPYYAPLQQAVKAGPAAAPPPEVQALLARHAGDLAEVRQALQGERCDWGLRYERGYSLEMPSLLGARTLGNLLVAEGHQRAQAGDTAGAAQRYLEAVRFGADFGEEPQFMMSFIGMAIAQAGLDSLGGLLTSELPPPPYAEVAARLARLEPVLPGAAAGLRGERLNLGYLDQALAAEFGGRALPARMLFALSPAYAVAGHAADRMEPALREAEAAAGDVAAAARVEAALKARAGAAWNPLALMPSSARASLNAAALRARLVLDRLALGLEQRRAAEGRYPAQLAGLPLDPLAVPPAPIRYAPAPDGLGYKLWSVGLDQADQGGQREREADIVLERRAPSP